MDYKTLCDTVAEKTGQRPATVKKVLNEAFATIKASGEASEPVGVGSFGTFIWQTRAEGKNDRFIVRPPKVKEEA